MKILYAASTFGHIRSFHVPYIKEMIARGHAVDVAGAGEPAGLPAEAGVFELPFEKNMFASSNFKSAEMLKQRMLAEKYDTVIVHTSLAAFFVRLAVRKLPKAARPYVINVVHGYLFDEKTPLLKRSILLNAEKIMAGVTDRLIVMNEEDLGIARSHHLCKSDSEIFKINGFGYDGRRFNIMSASVTAHETSADDNQTLNGNIDDKSTTGTSHTDINKKECRLIFVGEFSKRKNQEFLIKVLSELNKSAATYRLTLAGTGAEAPSCKRLARELGVEDLVDFHGFVSDIENLYAQADISVSASRSEGLPFNIMESLACGLPVVASRVKGHEDLVRPGENGELYKFGDIAGCVAAITKVRSGLESGTYTPQKIASSVEVYTLDTVLETNLNLMLNHR